MSNSQKPRPTLAEILGQPLSREKALSLIRENLTTFDKFQNFPPAYKEQILEFIQGNRGLPIYINVEMQKYGYAFTGERSTCYMSDLIMRQYNRIKAEKKNKFSFKDMKPVYIIVLMENSSKNFNAVAPHYIHRSQHSFDTGAEMNFLTNYIYISLDTFHSVSQNISNTLDAWLTFLSSDAPEDIINLVEAYPEFKPLYHDISLFRQNPKELMNMYSEVLLQMDKNTVTYMIEELKKEAEEAKREAKREVEEAKREARREAKLEVEQAKREAQKENALLKERIAELQAQLANQQNQS